MNDYLGIISDILNKLLSLLGHSGANVKRGDPFTFHCVPATSLSLWSTRHAVYRCTSGDILAVHCGSLCLSH